VRSTPLSFSVALMILSLLATANAQLLDLPESVVYDSLYNRYLVSNWGSGDMVQIDSNGVQDYFITAQACYAGLHIVGDNVYVAGRAEGIRGFDLETGDPTMELSIPGTVALNDVTSDTSGNLYVTDVNAHKIIRAKISDQTYSTFVDHDIYNPNGILFDAPNNRLLLVSSRNSAPLQAVSLADSTVSTIVLPGLDILDGLTEDNQRNLYFSSWGSQAVFRYDTTFSNPPQLVSTHQQYPADIFFNKHDNMLAVPIFYHNRVEFIEISPSSVEQHTEQEAALPRLLSLYQNQPNPFNATTGIPFRLRAACDVQLVVYNPAGQKVATLIEGTVQAGEHTVNWHPSTLTSGIYLYRLTAGEESQTNRMTLVK
jgi:sugar lactone lactonase YvrE